MLRRRWFNAGAGCARKSLHLHGYIWTCDVESIFTCYSLAHRDCSSMSPFGTEALASMLGSAEGTEARLSVCVCFAGRCSRLGRLAGISGSRASGCHKELAAVMWSRHSIHIVCTFNFLFCFVVNLNKMQALCMFTAGCDRMLWCWADTCCVWGTLLAPGSLRPTSTSLWLVSCCPL